MYWLLLSLLAVASWGIWAFLIKLGVRDLPWQTVLLAASIFGVPIALVVFLVSHQPLEVTPAILGISVGIGVFASLGTLAFYAALSLGAPSSVVVPMTAAYPVITVLLTTVFLKEPLEPTKVLAGLLFIAATILATR